MTPRLHIISADHKGRIDPILMERVLCQMPNRVDSIDRAEVLVVPVSYYEDFCFNRSLENIRHKPVILLDTMEFYGQKTPGFTHIFGHSHTSAWLKCANPEWALFSQWCASVDVKAQFIRELRAADASDKWHPLEWPGTFPLWEIESKSAFDVRPFEVFYNWGMSNHLRPMLHGQIYSRMGAGHVDVVGHYDHIDSKINEPHCKWLSIHTPHTHRVHFDVINLRQAQSKMSVSMPGAGEKCFRSTEHVANTVPVKLRDDLAWSFPWVNGENCLELPDPREADCSAHLAVFAALDLHPIYVAAQDLASRYSVPRYTSEYIMPKLLSCL